MSTPTSPNSPDPSAESESRPPEAADVSHTDPTGEPTAEPVLEPTMEPAMEPVTEPTTWLRNELSNEPATGIMSEPEATHGARSLSSEPSPMAPVTTEPEPRRPSGPHLPAILLGIACLAVAIVAIAQELGRLTIDWGNVGPLGIVAAGAVLVVLGLLGLMASRKS